MRGEGKGGSKCTEREGRRFRNALRFLGALNRTPPLVHFKGEAIYSLSALTTAQYTTNVIRLISLGVYTSHIIVFASEQMQYD